MTAGHERPNILFISADQHRYDSLGCSGHPLVKTPHIDRLAREGMRFTHAFTPIAVCCPARQSLLCGKWAEQHGGLWNFGISLPVRLFEEPTWTEDLQRSGYQMGAVGKWDIHPQKTPLDYGFTDWANKKDYHQWRSDQRLPEQQPFEKYQIKTWSPFGGFDPVGVYQTRTHWYADKAIEMIRNYASQGKPWHVALNFEEPHLPCYPANPFAAMYPPEQIPEWGSFRDTFENKPYIQRQQILSWGMRDHDWNLWSEYVSRYFAVVSQIDDAVGHVLNALDAMGLCDSTMVVYTSDHGDACGSHRMIDKHYIMYDDVVRVPLVIRWPGIVGSGEVCNAFVSNALDLASTLPEAAGLPVPRQYQGSSLMPLLKGEKVTDWREDIVSTYNGQQFGLYTQRMLRNRRWKYVWNLTDVDEFYDLENDPWEIENRIADPACDGVINGMRLRLLEQLKANGDKIINSYWTERQLAEGLKGDNRS